MTKMQDKELFVRYNLGLEYEFFTDRSFFIGTIRKDGDIGRGEKTSVLLSSLSMNLLLMI